jgi:hypothetical protein
MPTLRTDLRDKLERTCITARNLAERAAKDALQSLAVAHHEPYGHMKPEQRNLRNKLRARARQLGDTQDAKGQIAINHLVRECAYEHWHRMLFARFLAENNLLIEPDMGVAVSLEECKELAKDEKTNLWALAGRYAQTMLPEVFRSDDRVLQVPLAREDQLKLEELLDALAKDTFTASDSLGWCYQFWQSERKDQVNAAGNKIGADELPAVTQLFTEDYMVDFLLDNTLGAWHAGKILTLKPELAENTQSEEELRNAVSLPGCPWRYLRFTKAVDDKWTPAAGTFDGWPKAAIDLKCLDPCMGSGHFIVGMFERLVACRIFEEKVDEGVVLESVIRDNLFGLEIDPRCTQIAAFNLALAAWRRIGHCALPAMNLACSGLAPNARQEDWLKLAGGDEKLRNGMQLLYGLFQDAPVLGSLISPRAAEGDLLVAAFHELQPLLERALTQESKDETAHEMAVAARGVAKAAEILAGHFTLVATNVPYLGRGKQDDILKGYCDRAHSAAKADLATCFVDRCLSFCASSGSTALVTPQNWWFLGSYKAFRANLLTRWTLDFIVTLGEEAWQSFGDRGPVAALMIAHTVAPLAEHQMAGLDALPKRTIIEKAAEMQGGSLRLLAQTGQYQNPDHRIIVDEPILGTLLQSYADSFQGISPADLPHYGRRFWEISIGAEWRFWQSTVEETTSFGGRSLVLWWNGDLLHAVEEGQAFVRGEKAWGMLGIACRQMRNLSCTLFTGEAFDTNVAVIVPRQKSQVPAVWAFCSSPDFRETIRRIDKKVNVTNASFVKVPFDLQRWQKVAAERFPDGLPKPFSSDPTQWLFNGHPESSDQPLHVAVARLLGYRWPRQTGSSFPDCPALAADGLEKLADGDGIVCLPSVRGEEPAAERLRRLLAVAFDKHWKAQTELELIRASGSNAADLEEWLRNDFFEQHCDLFHQRPFLWHIWDGRKRDGFHALVNYHKLCEGNGKGGRMLESLTYAYLGDWIARQKDGVKRGEGGAEDRRDAALELQKRLEAILEGEPPFDLFARWKPLAEQPLGWVPDINDGVRMNIRPFLASDLPAGRAGAGVLRWKPNIKWDKDRGKEPERPRAEFPWFWNWDERTQDFMGAGKEPDGNRHNDCHYTNKAKQAARDAAKKGER